LLRKTLRPLLWMGGNPLGVGPHDSQAIHIQPYVTSGVTSEDIVRTIPSVYKLNAKFRVVTRAEVYNELLKLPLRFPLHPFERIQEQMAKSDVGYTVPLGPVDTMDPCPFFVHRRRDGRFNMKTKFQSKHEVRMHLTELRNIEGDIFRMEEELIKMFPTKRSYVREDKIILWGTGFDGADLVRHWLLGLGF